MAQAATARDRRRGARGLRLASPGLALRLALSLALCLGACAERAEDGGERATAELPAVEDLSPDPHSPAALSPDPQSPAALSPDPLAPASLVPVCEAEAGLEGLDHTLASLPPGALLRLAAGSADASLVIDRSLRLEAGGSRPVLTGVAHATVLVTGGRVELAGLVLQAPPDGPALRIVRGTVVLDGCVILSDHGDGVVLDGPDAHLVLRDTAVTTGAGAGLRLSGGASARLDNGEFVRCAVGVSARAAQVHAADLRVARCQRGLELLAGARLDLERGTIWGNTEVGLHASGGSRADLEAVVVRAPGGAPALRLMDGAVGEIVGCELTGTPAEVDHHAGAVTREHLQLEIAVGIDHHVLEALVEVRSGAAPHLVSCSLRNALGHGLHVQDATGHFEHLTIAGSVYFGVLLEDGAEPLLEGGFILGNGETGIFAWRDAGGRVERTVISRNGRGGPSGGARGEGWAQVTLTEGARTRLSNVEVSDGAAGGVSASGMGTEVVLDGLSVSGNGGDGVEVVAGAVVLANGLSLQGNQAWGMRVGAGGLAQLDGCTLAQNRAGGLHVEAHGEARVEGASVLENRGFGVAFDPGSVGTLRRNTIQDNGLDDVRIGEGAQVTRP